MEQAKFISQIDISNFKSIGSISIENLSRINVIIGRPNVGKSNILEALGLFAIPLLGLEHNLGDIVRATKINDLFNDSKQSFGIRIKQNDSEFFKIISASIDHGYKEKPNEEISYIISDSDSIENYLQTTLGLEFTTNNFSPIQINNLHYSNKLDLIFYSNSTGNASQIKNIAVRTGIKPYAFDKDKIDGSTSKYSFLQPPFGQNLTEVLNANFSDLRPTVSSYFEEFGIKIVLDEEKNAFLIQKENRDGTVKQLPYYLIADTLQRIIFNKAAIYSNSDSVLLFEEPEAHSFPPYISEFTNDVVNSVSNQFFIITHSPIILQDFIERSFDELSILLVDFDKEKNSTTIKTLSKDEMEEIRDNGVDLFFNYESYLIK